MIPPGHIIDWFSFFKFLCSVDWHCRSGVCLFGSILDGFRASYLLDGLFFINSFVSSHFIRLEDYAPKISDIAIDNVGT